MGYGFELKCKSCDYSKDFFLGRGMMDYQLEEVINEEHIKIKKMRQELLDLIKKRKVNSSNYGYEIFRCEKCEKLYRKFYVELQYDEDRVYKTEYKCTRCRIKMRKLEKNFNLKEISCPRCKDKALYRYMPVDWD